MSLTIIKRSPLLKNLIFFVGFVLAYIYISLSLYEQNSMLEKAFLMNVVKSHYPILALAFMTVVTVWLAKPISKIFLAAYLLSALGVTFPLFIYGFEKDLLFLNFIFLVSGFYFWIFWKLELAEATYNPKFELNELDPYPSQKLPLKIIQGEKQYKALLTNWDESSCFVILEQSWEELRGVVKVEIYFEGQVFEAQGIIVSLYGPGLGIKLISRENIEPLNWQQFYDIINDRGFI